MGAIRDPALVAMAIKIAILCLLWYIVSSVNNVIGKTVLNQFEHPMTLAMVQLISITVYSIPVIKMMRIRNKLDYERSTKWTMNYKLKYIYPLAFSKFFIAFTSALAIWKASVSYAHTVKSLMPLFVVVLSRVIMGEKQTTKVYLSLIPIMMGVAIATATELSFNMLGLIFALLSTIGFSLQNIFSKKVLKETGIHHLWLLHLLAKISMFLFLPVWLFYDLTTIWTTRHTISESTNTSLIVFLLLIDGFLNFSQNVIAFSVLNLVSPLTYSVCNASKRISIIAASLLWLQNPVTLSNILGMLMAIFGVFFYNKAKYDAMQEEKKRTILPMTTTKNDTNLLLKNHHHPHVNNHINNYSSYKNDYSYEVPFNEFNYVKLTAPKPVEHDERVLVRNGFTSSSVSSRYSTSSSHAYSNGSTSSANSYTSNQTYSPSSSSSQWTSRVSRNGYKKIHDI